MAIYEFSVPGLPPTLNQVRNASHWSKKNAWKDQFRDEYGWALREARIKPIEGTFAIEATLYYKSHPRDADGVVTAVKYMCDAMQDLELIPDDGPKHLVSVTLKSRKGEEPRIRFRIFTGADVPQDV